MKKKFKRDINSLETICNFITEFVTKNKLDSSLTFSINLAVEELFINSVKYNAGNPNEILIRLLKDADRLIVSLTDYDVEPYDIKQAKEYDRTQSLEERPIGGLGIHLVTQIADSVNYEYKNRQSKISLIIKLNK